MSPTVDDPAYWERLYAERHDGWDLGTPAPPFERVLRDLPVLEGGVVLGCGRGHEARLLAQSGWKYVVAVDFAPAALADARNMIAGTPDEAAVEWRLQDIFSLPQTDAGHYDLVLEHCSFCAIDPARREEYIRVVHRILRAKGLLVALFYTHGRPGGPPFSTTRDEVERLLAGRFVVERTEIPPDSVARRAGQELLVVARRR